MARQTETAAAKGQTYANLGVAFAITSGNTIYNVDISAYAITSVAEVVEVLTGFAVAGHSTILGIVIDVTSTTNLRIQIYSDVNGTAYVYIQLKKARGASVQRSLASFTANASGAITQSDLTISAIQDVASVDVYNNGVWGDNIYHQSGGIAILGATSIARIMSALYPPGGAKTIAFAVVVDPYGPGE